MDLLLIYSAALFPSSPVFPLWRAGAWSLYFQIATACSCALKRTFSCLSGSFIDSHQIASRLRGESPALGKGTDALHNYKKKKKSLDKTEISINISLAGQHSTPGRTSSSCISLFISACSSTTSSRTGSRSARAYCLSPLITSI